MAVIGYIRVSTIDQNSDLQRDALTSANCDRIFEDRMSGKVASRPGLRRALKYINRGDTLDVWKLDRLGNSVKNLIALIRGTLASSWPLSTVWESRRCTGTFRLKFRGRITR
ncbi:resolvase domain-containing protein [Enterobacter hormaechei]|nr:resolvase domain-containing protein [Enterobacter hormaechei]